MEQRARWKRVQSGLCICACADGRLSRDPPFGESLTLTIISSSPCITCPSVHMPCQVRQPPRAHGCPSVSAALALSFFTVGPPPPPFHRAKRSVITARRGTTDKTSRLPHGSREPLLLLLLVRTYVSSSLTLPLPRANRMVWECEKG